MRFVIRCCPSANSQFSLNPIAQEGTTNEYRGLDPNRAEDTAATRARHHHRPVMPGAPAKPPTCPFGPSMTLASGGLRTRVNVHTAAHHPLRHPAEHRILTEVGQ